MNAWHFPFLYSIQNFVTNFTSFFDREQKTMIYRFTNLPESTPPPPIGSPLATALLWQVATMGWLRGVSCRRPPANMNEREGSGVAYFRRYERCLSNRPPFIHSRQTTMRPLRSIRSFIDDDDDADGPVDLVLDAFVAVLYITSSGRLDFTFYRFVSDVIKCLSFSRMSRFWIFSLIWLLIVRNFLGGCYNVDVFCIKHTRYTGQ